MKDSAWLPVLIAVIGVVGVIVTAWFNRRSAKDTKEVESRRVEVEVQNADLSVLRTMITELRATQVSDREWFTSREARMEARFTEFKSEIRGYQAESRLQLSHIELLEQWIWDEKPPPPPPRPRAVESDGVSTAASPSVDDAV